MPKNNNQQTVIKIFTTSALTAQDTKLKNRQNYNLFDLFGQEKKMKLPDFSGVHILILLLQ